MKLLGELEARWILLLVVSATAFLFLGSGNQLAQTQGPTGHVNDLAGVVNDATRQQLETILTNLKTKTGIEFDVALVQTTAGKSIDEFSLQLAKDWNVALVNTPRKSLLLVIAVDERTAFTRLSRSVSRDLPEGILGDMSQKMRAAIEAGRFSEGLNAGVHQFVKTLSQKLAFNADELNETPSAVATPTPITTVAESTPTDVVGPAVISPPSKDSGAAPTRTSATRKETAAAKNRKPTITADDAAEADEVEATLGLPVAERVTKLKSFLEAHPDSKAKPRATELLISAHAAVGDDLLRQHDSAGGIAELMRAISDAPSSVSDKLFLGVIAQIPLNLFLRGEQAAALKAAQDIEAKFGNDPKHLLALSAFYVRIEQGSEAARLANQAVQLAPDLAEAHQGLGLALHVSLRLDDAAAEYKRALELDPNSKSARRNLADLTRAAGKGEEAVALYRQQLAAEPTDKGARTGLILSLLDLNRIEEAKGELEKALTEDPKNLTLLAGTAYWFAAHNDNESAVALAERAVNIEPRYTWSQIALARALVAQRKPLEAERAIRFARQYGKFPTLEYELANILVAASLFDEAAEVLSQSFTLKNGEMETRLGGQTPAHNASFLELLAPERRASIFQFTAADTDGNAKLLKSLLKFSTALANGGSINEEEAAAAAKEFASGDDAALVHRQLYAARRLLKKGVAFETAFELAEAARSSADAGLGVPVLTLAVQADEFSGIRARAIAQGGTPNIPDAPRNLMSNLLRGRIEDTSGWARLDQDKLDEAVDHLKRAIAILPQGTPAANTSLWRLGVALERQDKKAEALSYYIKGYNSAEPDAARRAVVEQLYRKVNGSLDGLDERIGPPPTTAEIQPAPVTPDSTSTPVETAPLTPTAESTPSPTPTSEPSALTAQTTPPAEIPAPSPAASPSPSSEAPGHTEIAPPPTPTPSPEANSQPTSEATPAPTPSVTEPSPAAAPTPTPEPAATPTPADAAVSAMQSALRTTLKITGRIKDANDKPLENAVVVLISPQGTVLTATTDEQGNYSFTVAVSLPSRSYRIIPSKEGLSFEPIDRTISILSDDVKELDFVGKRSP
ncbi:MAG TPA: TPM domain-containing protein [Pyrinomonadaceae bacterium]|nr:TPM domain-containing protein [Pyrinomonadaceae bacterium]